MIEPTLTGVPVFERYPVIRTGEREPLPELLRWLIWYRDNGTCRLCGASDVPTEIDHVLLPVDVPGVRSAVVDVTADHKPLSRQETA